jgi:hypothetical protein
MPRKSNLDSIVFQDRDIALLRGLFESRVMTTDHATTLYFGGKREYTKKRLQKIKRAGLITERPRRTFDKSVFFLTRKGLDLLQERGVLAEYPSFPLPALDRRSRVSDITIRHELAVMDVKTAFHFAIKKTLSFSIATFNTWPLLSEFKAWHPVSGKELFIRPDGFIRFLEKQADSKEAYAYDFFLEVDRSTEIQEMLVTRAACYFDHYKSGGFAVRNGGRRDDYKQFPFRVLMVFKTAERRNNTAERLLQGNLPILKQVCLATFEEVTVDPLGTVWCSPADYREATDGTPFEPSPQYRAREYKRQAERDRFVESRIKKFTLLPESYLKDPSTKSTNSLS